MRRAYLWIIIIIAATVVGGLALRFALNGRPSGSTVAPVQTTTVKPEKRVAAVASEVEGEVTVTRNGKRLKALDLMRLEEDDRIEVSPTGTLVIIWPSYGRTVAQGGTVFIIRRAKLSDDETTLNARIQLETGRVWTRLKRLLGPDSSFSVRASSVVATVRGTSFGVEREGPRVNVQVVESTVRVTAVRDREPTPEEIAGGILAETVEEAAGPSVDVSEKQEVEIDQVKAVSLEAMFAPREMTKEEIADPFVQAGNAAVPPEQLAAPEYIDVMPPDAPRSLDGVPPEPLPPPPPEPGLLEPSPNVPLEPVPATNSWLGPTLDLNGVPAAYLLVPTDPVSIPPPLNQPAL